MDKLPLEGIRILDFTVVWAGPFATMLLADFGAEVIRVESLQYFPSVTRGLLPRPDKAVVRSLPGYAGAYPEHDPGPRPWNRHPMFNPHARNKHSMTVDLRRPKGRELFIKLVSVSDVLVENHSARFMENLGLTYDVLQGSKPDLIMVSMPAFGMSGPYKYYQGFGINVESVCGFTWLRSYPDGDLSDTSATLHMDAASGASAAFAILAALHYRRRTGKGQFIDFGQAENLMQQIGEILMDYTLIAAWTRQHQPWEIMERLQRAGIAAGPVMREPDLFTDPHLHARGFFRVVTHPEAGTHVYPGIMWQMSKTPATIRRPPVRLGEDNEYVYRELL